MGIRTTGQLPALRQATLPRGVDPKLRFVRAEVQRWRHGVPERVALFALIALGLGCGLTLPLATALLVGLGLPSALILLDRPRRGMVGLRRALERGRDDPAAGQQALAELLERPADPVVRLEIAGRLAVAHLDAGELGRAVAVLEQVPAIDSRERALGLGLLGELMRSVVTWLGVSRFEAVAEASALAPGNPHPPADERDRDDYLAILAVLELLEAHAGAPTSVLEAAWRRCRASALDRRYPGLALISAAAVSARLPAARSMIEEAVAHGERGEWSRTLLGGLFPELISALGGELGYRSQAGDPRTLAILDRREPPAEIRELVERYANAPRIDRAGKPAALAAASVGLLAAGLAAPWIAPSLLAVGWLSARLRRRLRARPVAAMPYGPQGAWLREIADAPDAPAPLGDSSAPLRRDQLELYLCCVRAEQELARGNLEAAWTWLAWWFADRDYRKPAKVSLYPVAATLLRVAALSNRTAEARSLAGVVEASPARRLGLIRRTAYGDDPRALGYAKAMVFARVGAWTEAAAALAGIASLPNVILNERDEVLYVLVAQKVSALAPGVDPRLCAVSPASVERVRPWLTQIWPQLLQRLDAQRGNRRR